MDFWLLMSRHSFDDEPVAAYLTYEECVEAAQTIKPSGVSEFIRWEAVEFRDGKPVTWRRIEVKAAA